MTTNPQTQPAPDWSTRGWGRPVMRIVYPGPHDNPHLCATCDVRYHGIRIRGVRVFEGSGGALIVGMPQKKFGDTIQAAVYFLNPDEREQFEADVIWLYRQVAARRAEVTL